jgi:hypothetical protein
MSLCGGVAVIPQSAMDSSLKASEVRKTDPMLFRLLTLSRMITTGNFGEFLKAFASIRSSSSFKSFLIAYGFVRNY